ncbi:hypothetical protein BDR06DRAFT_842232, partial [Suillus hirtellus]
MNTINGSTGYSPFQLHLGRSLQMLPPIIPDEKVEVDLEEQCVQDILVRLLYNVMEAQDNLLNAKASQAVHINKKRAEHITFKIGDHIMLATKHRHHEYIQKGDRRSTK